MRRLRLPRPALVVALLPLSLLPVLAGCDGPAPAPGGGTVTTADLEALEARMEERFAPGLHSLMMELQHRHATLWFAGEAENWPLVDYFLHEMEELIEDIEEIHPVYREVPVAEMLAEMTVPAIELLEEAVEREDRGAFVAAYDRLTAACNACHVASDRDAVVMQRPTAPPLTNLRYLPGR